MKTFKISDAFFEDIISNQDTLVLLNSSENAFEAERCSVVNTKLEYTIFCINAAKSAKFNACCFNQNVMAYGAICLLSLDGSVYNTETNMTTEVLSTMSFSSYVGGNNKCVVSNINFSSNINDYRAFCLTTVKEDDHSIKFVSLANQTSNIMMNLNSVNVKAKIEYLIANNLKIRLQMVSFMSSSGSITFVSSAFVNLLGDGAKKSSDYPIRVVFEKCHSDSSNSFGTEDKFDIDVDADLLACSRQRCLTREPDKTLNFMVLKISLALLIALQEPSRVRLKSIFF